MKKSLVFFMLMVFCVSIPAVSFAQAQFEEVGGYVIMEMESVSITQGDEWVKESDLSDYKGSGYYRFTGNNICSGPAKSPLKYTFKVNTGGIYELRLRAAKILHCVMGQPHNNGQCDEQDRTCMSLGQPNAGSCGANDQCIRTDISNDAFVYIEDAQGKHIKFENQPSDTKPIKLFGGKSNEWAWTGKRALDTAGKKWDAHWDLSPGEYTLVVSGRSQSFRIDRMVLFDTANNTINGANDLPETLSMSMLPQDMGRADMGESDMSVDMSSGEDMNTADMSTKTDMAVEPDQGLPQLDMSGTSDQSDDMNTKSDLGLPNPKAPKSGDDGCSTTPTAPIGGSGVVALLFVLVGMLGVRRGV